MHEIKNHTVLEESIIKTLVYYDIFQYPLKTNEVFRFLRSNSVSESDVTECLNVLAEQKIISRFGEFYTLQKNESGVRRRIKGNTEAERYLPLAKRQALLISKFPFIKAVFASGSLSKGYMDEHSDLDFFVITEPNRLWICRTLLALYKRVFLKNSHKHFCVNYFIDSNHLEIEEKNLFTATELATVIPLWDIGWYYDSLQKKNIKWLVTYFPNYRPLKSRANEPGNPALIRKILETVFNIFFPSLLDFLLMKVALLRLKRMYGKNYSSMDFDIAFKTKRYASKNHPRNYQKTVSDHYTEKLETFMKNFESVK